MANIGAGYSPSNAAEGASCELRSIDGSMENGSNFYLDHVWIITYLNNSGSSGVYSHLIALGI